MCDLIRDIVQEKSKEHLKGWWKNEIFEGDNLVGIILPVNYKG